jgi:hypothetical protein
MGHWGVKSYENDEAHDALDAGFAHVHADRYDRLMDDGNPLSYEQVQEKLADRAVLDAALGRLVDDYGDSLDAWDDEARLAYAGVAVRLAECRVTLPEAVRLRALEWLRVESIEWAEATRRRLRRDREFALLEKAGNPGASGTV